MYISQPKIMKAVENTQNKQEVEKKSPVQISRINPFPGYYCNCMVRSPHVSIHSQDTTVTAW